jgi:hypothetical protein
MNGSASRSELLLVLAQGTTTETTEWWRIIALVAVTLATVAILALIFRPSMRANYPAVEPNGSHPEAPTPGGEPTRPSAFPEPGRAWEPAPTDVDLAAERLRQIVSRSTDVGRPGPRPRRTSESEAGAPAAPSETGAGAQHGPTGEEKLVETTGAETERGAAETVRTGPSELEEQINRLFGRPGIPGNVVQFTPRRAAGTESGQAAARPGIGGRERRRGPKRAITGFPVDTATRDGVTSTIQELLFCANVGELLHGFALYTDRFLFQFMDDSRMSEDEFRKTYSDVPAKDPSEWTRVDSIGRFTRLPDGRVSVRVRYIDGAQIDGTEEFVLKHDPRLERWLIDDIRPI